MVFKSDFKIFSSTVIPTIGRRSLARSVESVLSQDVRPEEFEVIVVNDSGRPLVSEEWQRSDRVQILHTNRHERSVARNTGAAFAHGTYLHFLDDDDWMLPGAFKELWAIARATNAPWVYGITRFVDREGKLLSESHIDVSGNGLVQVMATGAWLPIQASLIKAQCFIEVGGFDHRLAICEDKDIGRRIALMGNFAHIKIPVACILIDRATSTSPYDKYLYYNQLSRDNVLSKKGSFARMRASATSSYWRGRLVRIYLAVMVWNLQKGKLLKAMRWASEIVMGFFLSLPFLFSLDFLQGVFWGTEKML